MLVGCRTPDGSRGGRAVLTVPARPRVVTPRARALPGAYFRVHRVSPRWAPRSALSADDPAGRVFVGGTGRSGTTVVARLLGAHPRYALVPVEARFHVDWAGLPDVLANQLFVRAFHTRMRGRWFLRTSDDGPARGLSRVTSPAKLDRALQRFDALYGRDRRRAGRALLRMLLDPVARRAGKPGWVEMSPPTIACAPFLLALVPHARFVHVVRDGRDVASSVARMAWGPDTFEAGLAWWADQLRAAEHASRRLPPSCVHVVALEQLTAGDTGARDAACAALLEFLQVGPDPAVNAFARERLDPVRAHIGRWADDVPAARRAQVTRAYERLVAGLRRDGVRCLSPMTSGRD